MTAEVTYDVFLSHNPADKARVRRVAMRKHWGSMNGKFP
jgi:hypothetical protein